MTPRPAATRRLAAFSCAVVALASCSSASDGPSDDTYRLSTEIQYLHLPPESSDGYVIQATDFLRVADILDKPRFDPDAPAGEVAEWYQSVSSPLSTESTLAPILPASFGWDMHLTLIDSVGSGLGYSIRNVERFTEIATPPHVSLVAQGSFDESAVTAALGEASDGVWSFGNGLELNMELRDVSPPLGQGVNIGRADGRAILGRVAERATSVKDTERSVASDEHIAAVARGLDAQGDWYSALIFPARTLDAGLPGGLSTPVDLTLRPFSHLGIALDQVDDDNLLYVAYSHETVEAAEANAQAIPDILEEVGSLQGVVGYGGTLTLVDTSVDDALLTVTLKMDDEVRGHQIWGAIYQPHPLFSYR